MVQEIIVKDIRPQKDGIVCKFYMHDMADKSYVMYNCHRVQGDSLESYDGNIYIPSPDYTEHTKRAILEKNGDNGILYIKDS